jgi:hypothetical protein
MKVDRLPVDLGEVVRELVHARFLCAPVVPGAPVLHHLLEVVVGHAVRPVVAGSSSGVAGAGEPVVEVVKLGLRDLDDEGTDVG